MLFKSNLNIICNYLNKLPKYIYNTDGLINDLLTANNEVNCQTKQYLFLQHSKKDWRGDLPIHEASRVSLKIFIFLKGLMVNYSKFKHDCAQKGCL